MPYSPSKTQISYSESSYQCPKCRAYADHLVDLSGFCGWYTLIHPETKLVDRTVYLELPSFPVRRCNKCHHVSVYMHAAMDNAVNIAIRRYWEKDAFVQENLPQIRNDKIEEREVEREEKITDY